MARVVVDGVAVLVLVGLFFAVYDVGSALRLPYWLDEAWVALSTRLPLSDLPTDTTTTPVGWSLLLRLIPFPNDLRLLPLGFLGASIVLSTSWAVRWHGLGRTSMAYSPGSPRL